MLKILKTIQKIINVLFIYSLFNVTKLKENIIKCSKLENNL